MSREQLRARLAEAVAACSADGPDDSGAAVWGALLAYAPHLGASARYLDDAVDLEVAAIQDHARRAPRRLRAPPYTVAAREARARLGFWFASYVRDGRDLTPEAVFTLRPSSVAVLACAVAYRRG